MLQEFRLSQMTPPSRDIQQIPEDEGLSGLATSPLHRHLNKLIDESSEDLSKLILVSDNARLLPPSAQSTQFAKSTNRPFVSRNSFSDLRALNRPCRWTSDTSPHVDRLIKAPSSKMSDNLPAPLPGMSSSYAGDGWDNFDEESDSDPVGPVRLPKSNDFGLVRPERRGST